jgi:hypothetical protein
LGQQSSSRPLVLLAAFATLRFGELAALRRKDINLSAPVVTSPCNALRPSYVTAGSSTRRRANAKGPAQGIKSLSWPFALSPLSGSNRRHPLYKSGGVRIRLTCDFRALAWRGNLAVADRC